MTAHPCYVQFSEALRRFGGNRTLYLRFLRRFLEDDSFLQLIDALEKQDTDSAFLHAHTIKGLSAQLGLSSLHLAAAQLCVPLRKGEAPLRHETEAFNRLYYETLAEIQRITDADER